MLDMDCMIRSLAPIQVRYADNVFPGIQQQGGVATGEVAHQKLVVV